MDNPILTEAVEAIDLTTIELTMRAPHATATTTYSTRKLLIVSIHGGGQVGWGEVSADGSSYCLGESATSARQELESVAASLIGTTTLTSSTPSPMAAAGLAGAWCDLAAKQLNQPLSALLGSARSAVTSRAVLGRSPDVATEVDAVVEDGYRFIKLKLSTDDDLATVERVRFDHPELGIAVDMNGNASAATPPDFFNRLDAVGLDLIEQPFPAEDRHQTVALAARLNTPIGVDESIRTGTDVNWATDHALIVNAKIAKFSGLASARDATRSLDPTDYWWGGMYETGIGRATALAVAASSSSTMPTDLGASHRYYVRDLTTSIELQGDHLVIPEGPGIGVDVDVEFLSSEGITQRIDGSV